MDVRLSCDDLVAEVRAAWDAKGLDAGRVRDPAKLKADRIKVAERVLAKYKWLDEYADTNQAAEFTGLNALSIRSYHTQGKRKRASNDPRWAWPEPDLVIARRPAWKLRTIVIGQALKPGRGAGGGRPWHKEKSPGT